MPVEYILLIVGLILLYKGGDWLVEGSVVVARRFGIRDIVVGLTIVSFGTSAPEMVVSVLASAKGSAALSVGNVVGSNIANILLVLGLRAIVYPLSASRGTVWKEIPFVLLASVVLAIQANDRWLDGADRNLITRGDGLMLLAFFVIFIYYIWQLISEGMPQDEVRPEAPARSMPVAWLEIVVGLVLLMLGGDWVVDGAVVLAANIGMPENVIGLTVVAVGTSLPELAASVIAAFRKNAEIAVGNVVGSSIFNILFVLGISSTVRPLDAGYGSNLDILAMLGATVLLFVVMQIGKPLHQIQRREGALFFILYVGYITWLLMRT